MGYIMGKAEGLGEDWHGHVTALTVAPEFRRIGLAHHLMNELEARFNLFFLECRAKRAARHDQLVRFF
jgi:ribosomal protein S18 acetylase RimI-like enzyme